MGIPAITVGTEPLEQRDMPTTAQLENQMVGTRAISFAIQNIPPPSALYISNDDTLQVTVANSLAGQTVIIVGQILLPDGRLQPNQWTVTPGSSRALQNWFFPLGEGYLMNISVAPTVTPTRRGQTWVQVGLRRGGQIGGSLVQLLISDYADSFYGGSWPGGSLHNSLEGKGYLYTIAPANPPPNTNMTVTVPSNAHWQLQAFNYSIQTSATVANRNGCMFINDDAGHQLFVDACETAQTASNNITYIWGRMLGTTQTAPNPFFTVCRSLPEHRLGPGFTLNAFMNNKQATDQLQAFQVLIEEFLSP